MNSILPRTLPLLLLAASGVSLITCAGGGRAVSYSTEQRALLQRRDFVYVNEAVPGVIIDLRYAVTDNVAGKRLYPSDMPCLLHRKTAAKLLKAQQILEPQGYGLKLWDAWRPPSSHLALWYSNPYPDYVTPPENGLSYHCFGVAVDVTLVDSKGFEVPMPSAFDEFSEHARSKYKGGNREVRRNVDRLQSAMKQAGFVRIESEWWHFFDPSVTFARPVFAAEFRIDVPVRKVHIKSR